MTTKKTTALAGAAANEARKKDSTPTVAHPPIKRKSIKFGLTTEERAELQEAMRMNARRCPTTQHKKSQLFTCLEMDRQGRLVTFRETSGNRYRETHFLWRGAAYLVDASIRGRFGYQEQPHIERYMGAALRAEDARDAADLEREAATMEAHDVA